MGAFPLDGIMHGYFTVKYTNEHDITRFIAARTVIFENVSPDRPSAIVVIDIDGNTERFESGYCIVINASGVTVDSYFAGLTMPPAP